MSQKQLPDHLKLDPACIARYNPSMNPHDAFTYDGTKRVIKPGNLMPFMEFYFRLIDNKSCSEMIWNATMERSVSDIKADGIILQTEDSLLLQYAGSIELLRQYRDEAAKTRDAAVQKGWPLTQWPIDCLDGLVHELDSEIEMLQNPHEPARKIGL